MTEIDKAQTFTDLSQHGQQGDLVPGVRSMPRLGADGTYQSMPTEYGVCIVSQTCDVVGGKPNVLVAAVVQSTGAQAREDKSGRSPGLLWIADHGDDSLFADLDLIATVDKLSVSGLGFIRGLPENDLPRSRAFSAGIARKLGRAALPDVVVTILQPLRKKVVSKARKVNSPWGQVLQDVAEVRVGGWDNREVELLFVLRAGVLSPFERPLPSSDLVKRDVTSLLDELSRASGLAREEYWHQLATAIADWLQQQDCARDFTVIAEVVDEEELTVARAREYDVLDFEYLSGDLT